MAKLKPTDNQSFTGETGEDKGVVSSSGLYSNRSELLDALMEKVRPVVWAHGHGKPTLNKDLSALREMYQITEVMLNDTGI